MIEHHGKDSVVITTIEPQSASCWECRRPAVLALAAYTDSNLEHAIYAYSIVCASIAFCQHPEWLPTVPMDN